MCGIAGILLRQPIRANDFLVAAANMIAALRHRGPDGQGYWVDSNALFVHTRLAILDPKGGHQPLTNEDGSIVVTFNGEIYNSPELRQHLQTRGHVFRSSTDTEVLVHLYEECGYDTPRYLKGMFAFAIWDSRRKECFIARDHFGVKPLYYGYSDDHLVFASQPSAIIASGKAQFELDPASIPSCLYYGYTPPWRCVYRNISKLPPGHYLVWQQGYSQPRLVCYWRIPLSHRVKPQDSSVWEHTKERIAAAVRSSLLSDVPIGLALSGGLDSAILAYHIKRDGGLSPRTFTVRWDRASVQEDEWYLAQLLIRHLRLTGHTVYLNRGLEQHVADIYRTLDEPLGDTSLLPLHALCTEARQHVKVLVTGDGGDELFAGYHRYWVNSYEHIISRTLGPSLVRGLSRVCDILERWGLAPFQSKLSRLCGRLLLQPGLRYAVSLGQVPLPVMLSWIVPELADILFEDLRAVADFWDRCPQQNQLSRMLYCDLRFLLPEALLMKADRASMAVGVEIRPALLDHELLEWAMSLPGTLKLYRGQTKYLLRQAYRNDLPKPVLFAPKRGFHLRNLTAWVQKCIPQLLAMLRERRKVFPFLNFEALEKSISAFRGGRGELAQALWNLYSFMIWHENWSSKYSSCPYPVLRSYCN
ncbi:MAG: asparagine synthase (glutamine-hydrolyzing) [Gemmatales bacterium]|nr:asparagine synthase (glutamine-hydrolyzing) [Gemmatales bacterium]